MKAAVIHTLGDTPRVEDFPDPVLEDGDVTVKVMLKPRSKRFDIDQVAGYGSVGSS